MNDAFRKALNSAPAIPVPREDVHVVTTDAERARKLFNPNVPRVFSIPHIAYNHLIVALVSTHVPRLANRSRFKMGA
jgi:hypothetical protein